MAGISATSEAFKKLKERAEELGGVTINILRGAEAGALVGGVAQKGVELGKRVVAKEKRRPDLPRHEKDRQRPHPEITRALRDSGKPPCSIQLDVEWHEDRAEQPRQTVFHDDGVLAVAQAL